jgi:hypothetical protein
LTEGDPVLHFNVVDAVVFAVVVVIEVVVVVVVILVVVVVVVVVVLVGVDNVVAAVAVAVAATVAAVSVVVVAIGVFNDCGDIIVASVNGLRDATGVDVVAVFVDVELVSKLNPFSGSDWIVVILVHLIKSRPKFSQKLQNTPIFGSFKIVF